MVVKIRAKKLKSKKTNLIWFVYMLECSDGRIYTGITTNLEARFQRHVSGRGAKFTRRNKPSHIIASTVCKNRSEASKLEYAIKQLRPKEKRRLAEGWVK
ncbi:MAG: GIY-YIG nuclease family protein [Alphaproteobacteria bacterium]